MSSLLDDKQIEAQKMYPHFFERFKTDGVEHNMYIGESITKQDSFNMIYLYNLRSYFLRILIAKPPPSANFTERFESFEISIFSIMMSKGLLSQCASSPSL